MRWAARSSRSPRGPGAGLDELRAAIDRALRAERRAIWHWRPGGELRARIDAVRDALPAAWRSAARCGAAVADADDALALWALTCIEPRTGGPDDDELDVPDALRAAVVAEPAPRDDEAVLARWAWLDREIPPLVSRPPDRS